jgi:hypothetical protein
MKGVIAEESKAFRVLLLYCKRNNARNAPHPSAITLFHGRKRIFRLKYNHAIGMVVFKR